MNVDSRRSTGARSRGNIAYVAVAVAAAGAVVLLALHAERLLQVFPRYSFVARHLPGRGLDGPDPIYTHVGYQRPAHVDTAAIRRAGELIPNEAVYYIRTAVSNRNSGNVMLAARLFFLPAVPSQKPKLADWVLSYRVRRSGSVSRHVYRLDRDLRLARLR